MKHHPCFLFIALVFTMLTGVTFAEESYYGTMKGQVIDRETKIPLPGANILIVGTRRGTISNPDGTFMIPDIPVGNYTVQFSYLGYESYKAADVIIRSGRATVLRAELKTSVLEMEETSVTGGYFSGDPVQPTSMIGFSHEEIRRAPGSGGDVSRIIYGLPGVAKANDERNNLIVRGGSPIENSFFVDNIEIPNINHFPTQGSSGGAIGILNVDLVNDVTFRTGGFSAMYGDRLSSVMEINLREGNRDEFNGQIDLSLAGIGTVLEGPIGDRKGSWLISARRSYVDIIAGFMDFGVAPKYGDFQGKVVYDIDKENFLSVIEVFGLDLNTI
jgi:hypothetical protein